MQKTRKIPDSEDMGKKEARKAARALLEVTPIQTTPQPEKAVIGLYALLEEYILIQKGLTAEGTQKSIKGCVLRWFQAAGWTHWGDVTPESVSRGYASILKAIKEGEMEFKYWALVRCYALDYCRYAQKAKLLAENPLEVLPAPKKTLFKKNPVTWTQEEFEAVHGLLEPFLAKQFWLMRYTGMDLADIADLRRFHVVRDNEGEWMIRKPRKKEERFPDAWILFPLNDFVRDIFLEARERTQEAEDLLFPGIELGRDGQHSKLYARARYRWRLLYGNRRFKNVKTLRHTFASWAINELKIPLHVVQDWVGHTPGSTVLRERYLERGSTAGYARMLGSGIPALRIESKHGGLEQGVGSLQEENF